MALLPASNLSTSDNPAWGFGTKKACCMLIQHLGERRDRGRESGSIYLIFMEMTRKAACTNGKKIGLCMYGRTYMRMRVPQPVFCREAPVHLSLALTSLTFEKFVRLQVGLTFTTHRGRLSDQHESKIMRMEHEMAKRAYSMSRTATQTVTGLNKSVLESVRTRASVACATRLRLRTILMTRQQ